MRILFAFIACALLSACAASGDVFATQVQGVSIVAKNMPDATVMASIGWIDTSALADPIVDKAGKPITVKDMCGTDNAIAVYATNNVGASAGVSSPKAPAVSLAGGQGIAIGVPAVFTAMADLQQASVATGSTNNANAADLLKAYRVCPIPTPAPAGGPQ